MTDDITALRAAIAAGPTPGPWEMDRRNWPMTVDGRLHRVIGDGRFPTAFVPAWSEPGPGEVDGTQEALANAALIATASPDRITRVLDALEASQAECARLRTVMVAAAEEIAAHWDAHCDAEEYGPINLLHRLEEGIASEYGYTAGAFAKLKDENARLRAALEDIADPIAAWQRDLPEGYTLDGAAAVSMSNNAEIGRRMARAALAPKETT